MIMIIIEVTYRNYIIESILILSNSTNKTIGIINDTKSPCNEYTTHMKLTRPLHIS